MLLKIGDNHSDVIKIKQILNKQGFWPYDNFNTNYTTKLSEAVAYFQQTHLNEHGEPCGVDGSVGPETWWALNHPTGIAQKSNLPNNQIPKGIGDLRTKILEVALAQHGIKETPNGSNRGNKPRGGVDKFLPDWVKKPGKKGPAWCMFFVSFVTQEAFDKYPLGRRYGSCKQAWNEAGKLGMQRDFGVPGDAFMMLHGNGTGHVGFVYNMKGQQLFNTVEGNCGNRVKIGKRNTESVVGFINFCKDNVSDFEEKFIDVADVSSDGTR